MKNSTRPLSIATAILALAGMLLIGCSDSNTIVPDGDPQPDARPDAGPGVIDDVEDDIPETPDAEDEPDAEVVECEPNEIIECVVENTPAILQCNFRGDMIFQAQCGPGEVCRTADGVPECIEVNCIPDSRICFEEDNEPGICDVDGQEYVRQGACEAGELCQSGACLDPCDIAERERSYIGCEYWPVELDNYLLIDESTSDAPFAVVLANPQAESARVSVFTPEGDFLESIPEVTVGSGGFQRPQMCRIDSDCGNNGFCDGGFCIFVPIPLRTEVLDASGAQVTGAIEGQLEGIEVPPGGQLQVIFPRNMPEPYVSSIAKLSWRVLSDRPVVAYQFNPLCCNYSFTNDASILLPKGALTENYVAMSYPAWKPRENDSFPATLTIVATEDDTEVLVAFRDPRIRPDPEGRVPMPDENGEIRVTLQAQEVLNIESGETTPEVDLTGSVITASAPVAVFGGHQCTDIPFSLAACDHIEQQLFPRETWGRNYLAAPLKLRGEGPPQTREATYWKFLAHKDNTNIQLDRPFNELRQVPQSAPPASVPNCEEKLSRVDTITLNAGEFCEFGTNKGFAVNATEPILLGAFMSGQFSTGNRQFGNQAGDPAFFLVSPQEQYLKEYDFLTPATYALDFVTVIIPAGAVLNLDGEVIDPQDPEYEPEFIISQNAVWAHIPLDDGPHRISSNVPFGIIVYAYDDFVSYAYTGGLDLKKLNE